ncbi:hypothetical protein D3C80_1395630 [compost metagenome]
MGSEQGQGALPDIAREAAVGVGPVFAQGEGEARHEVVKGAATLGGGIGVDGVIIVALPHKIRRQGGAPAKVAEKKRDHQSRESCNAREQ